MRISSLELSGFKSFHKKTRLEFHKGSNAVVGPNGCGKSNVIDAVRWVTGEQNPRMLRASAMEDLVSDGTVSLKPVGMAEVTMVLSEVPGRGFEDISITRRYFRSGESEYSINGAVCRLKDIVDIFMDTGSGARSHSIIGQGEVEGFVMAKPEEKRRLIEEVAGVVRYKTRRKETHSRLKQTEENLTRIRDLSKDTLRRRDSLKRQAEQARKLNELSEKAARLEILMLAARKAETGVKLSELDKEKSAIEQTARGIEEEKNAASAEMRELEGRSRQLEESVSSADSEILAAREKINGETATKELFAGRRADIDALVSRLENEKLSLSQQTAEIGKRAGAAQTEREQAEMKESDIATDLEVAEKELEALRAGAQTDRDGIEEIRDGFFAAVEQCDRAEAEYRRLAGEAERLSVRSGFLLEQKGALSAEKSKLAERREQFASRIEEIKAAQEQTSKRREGIAAGLDSSSGEHEKLLETVSSLKEKRSRAASRLEELKNIQNSFEWLPESVRDILLEGKTDGVLGVLSDFVSVPGKYSKAFEAALGERLGWIVVGTGGDAERAIEKLREKGAGRATFMPAGGSSSGGGSKVPSRAVAVADIVKTSGGGKEALQKILRGICVVDTLEDAFECAREAPGLSFATLSGEFLDSSGAVSGGVVKGGVFERKSEIERLGKEAGKLEGEIAALLEKADGFEARISGLKSEVASLDENLQTNRVKLGSLESDLEGFTFSLEGKEAKLLELETQSDQVSGELKQKTGQSEQCGRDLERLRSERDERRARLSEFEEKSSGIEEKENALVLKAGELRMEAAALRQRRENLLGEIENLGLREKEVDGRAGEISSEIQDKAKEKSDMEVSSGEAQRRIETLTGELEERRKGVDEIRGRRAETAEKTASMRERIEGLDKRLDETRTKRGDLEVNLRTIRNNVDYISGKIKEVSEKNGAQMPPAEEVEAADTEVLDSELTALRARIDGFGLVNLLAPDEYEEAEKEHGFLEGQIDDLEKTAASLKKSISQLDRESADKFAEAFEEVDIKFRELLPKLFKGGEGRLVMTDPDDPIETGIDIVVKPGGKKAQNMNLLSGGEKALSAIAFIISSCLVRPLPFIILDEIDAPLDESNTGRFAALIKDISRSSQTLVVTHNRTTISDVDALIGITASKASNSAVVSVDLAKAV